MRKAFRSGRGEGSEPGVPGVPGSVRGEETP